MLFQCVSAVVQYVAVLSSSYFLIVTKVEKTPKAEKSVKTEKPAKEEKTVNAEKPAKTETKKVETKASKGEAQTQEGGK